LRRVLESWPDDGGTRAILARTNAELLPAAAVALELRLPFRAPRLRFLSEDRRVDALLAAAAAMSRDGSVTAADSSPLPLLVALARAGVEAIEPPAAPICAAKRSKVEVEINEMDDPLPLEMGELLAALVGWAAPYRTLAELGAALEEHRGLLAELRRDDALLTLATAHSTKGLEFDHVAVIGMDAGRFPSARSLRESTEPERVLEEERRLAYVAWTRARRSLTLVYDPASPSQFLLEAFSDRELGVESDTP
jgi:hypothetical protein